MFRTSNKIKQQGGREVKPGIFVHDDGFVTQIFESQEDYDLALAAGRVHSNPTCAQGTCGEECKCRCHESNVRASEDAPPPPPDCYSHLRPAWTRRTAKIDERGVPYPPTTEELRSYMKK